jgi:hypothetical protein
VENWKSKQETQVNIKMMQKMSRAEYFLSQNSFEAIDAILDAQKEMIANEGYMNLLNLAKDKNATIELEAVIAKIDEA